MNACDAIIGFNQLPFIAKQCVYRQLQPASKALEMLGKTRFSVEKLWTVLWAMSG
jgi:hypothetical protein